MAFNVLYILMLATMFTVLVAAHELGHFLFARFFKMDVEEFSIGFGKPAWTYMIRKGTRFSLRPIPLGGFVRIAGMNPQDDGSETAVVNGFYSKAPWKRFLTLFAGPLFSILTGLAIAIPLLAINGVKVPGTVAGKVLEGGAEKAGLRSDDRLVAISGVPVHNWYEMVVKIRDRAGESLTVDYERQGQLLHTTVVPVLSDTPTPYLIDPVTPAPTDRRQAIIGMMSARTDLATYRMSLGHAIGTTVRWPFIMIKSLLEMARKPATISENVGGPISIARESYSAAKNGWDEFVELAAGLSISLGIFNLLPFPPFDGGQMLMAFIEMLRRGRRLSMRMQEAFSGVGLVLLLALVAFVIFTDVQKMFPSGDSAAPTRSK